jgi:L-fucose/D-arabinose isomerase
MAAKLLPAIAKPAPRTPVIGVFSPCDPRIDADSRRRAQNIIRMTAEAIGGAVLLPDKTAVPVVYSDMLVDSERQADAVAQQFRAAGVNILVLCPDTWSFPQLTGISVIQQFPADTPVNITCGNSGPKPGVVYAHALNGALAQYGRMTALNVGNWPDTGMNPVMSEKTAKALIDWCYAAVTVVALKGRRVVVFGHDSMGMETAMAHIIPTRNTFGVEYTRLDMKLLADMLAKKAYKAGELVALRGWINKHIGKRLELKSEGDSERFNQSLAMYLIVRDIMAEINAVGGGFMSQLEWGSDKRGLPLPVADVMESLFNSTFDHNGPKQAIPYATEADCQALLTMLFMTWLAGGNPPLFMDLRKVWENWEIKDLAKKMKVSLPSKAPWLEKGLIDGNNSGSASFDWAGKAGDSAEKLLKGVQMPLADPGYFPGGGNSVTFMSPAGIQGIAGRMAYSCVSGKFSMVWDEAVTTAVPEKLEKAMCNLTNWNWPHTFLVPKYATMTEFKQYAVANHLHMIWGLPVARLQHWMDMTGVMNCTPWAARPSFIEGTDRPLPLAQVLNGGEVAFKMR